MMLHSRTSASPAAIREAAKLPPRSRCLRTKVNATRKYFAPARSRESNLNAARSSRKPATHLHRVDSPFGLGTKLSVGTMGPGSRFTNTSGLGCCAGPPAVTSHHCLKAKHGSEPKGPARANPRWALRCKKEFIRRPTARRFSASGFFRLKT